MQLFMCVFRLSESDKILNIQICFIAQHFIKTNIALSLPNCMILTVAKFCQEMELCFRAHALKRGLVRHKTGALHFIT